jgi:hypothetical protein
MNSGRTSMSNEWFAGALKDILSSYVGARAADHLDSSHRLWCVARQMCRDLEGVDAVRGRGDLKVCWSFGQGAWARVPWIAILDKRVARATSDGLYVIYLFREDMSGVYATLNQGITKEKERLGSEAGRAAVRQRASDFRRYCTSMEAAGFLLNHDVDLHSTHPLARDYQHGTVAQKLYDATAVPRTPLLLQDLEVLLAAYEKLVPSINTRRT